MKIWRKAGEKSQRSRRTPEIAETLKCFSMGRNRLQLEIATDKSLLREKMGGGRKVRMVEENNSVRSLGWAEALRVRRRKDERRW